MALLLTPIHGTPAKAILAEMVAHLAPTRRDTLGTVLLLTDTAARSGDLNWNLSQAAYGISWAIETGRLDGAIASRLMALKGKAAAKLVAEVASACAVSAEVPRYLISRA